MKRWTFTILAVLLPFAGLAALEGVLRLVGYGNDLQLVHRVTYYGKQYYQLNRNAGKRYFRGKFLAVPEMEPEVFACEKPDHLYRIFVLGGSTAAGFPFQINARFSQLLEARLNRLFQGRFQFEVINAGLSAINSYSVLDIVRELKNYEPDLFLIYMGHNEFYGAYGVGSTESFGKSRRLILLYLQLNNLRLFHLVRNAVTFLIDLVRESRSSGQDQATLMENVVQNKEIRLDSRDYRLARENFRKNLREILRLARSTGAGVLLCTLVRNEKDQPPFVSLFRQDLPDSLQRLWEKLYQWAQQVAKEGDKEKALSILKRALNIDSTRADGVFFMAQLQLSRNQTKIAKRLFARAADLDALRFRATTEWNRIIHEVAQEEQVPLVDIRRVFEKYSPSGIPGKELIFEHLHPNFRGYCLMAQAILETMKHENFVLPAREWPAIPELSKDEWMQLAEVTRLDLHLAAWRIRRLTSRWPFRPRFSPEILSPRTWMDSLAVAYLEHRLPWSEVHYQAAAHYHREGWLDSAMAEYRAVARIRPDSYYPVYQIGSILLEMKRPEKALHYLKKAWQLNSRSPYTGYRLGTAYLLTGKFSKAGEVLEKTLVLQKEHPVLKKEERVRLHYALSLAYIQLNEYPKARKMLEWIRKNAPTFRPAEVLLERLQKGEKIRIEFNGGC